MREVGLPEAVEVLRRGQILVYPTETFYGLGADIFQPKALESLFQMKGRAATKAVSILVSKTKQLQDLVLNIDSNLLKIINKFLPGPLTLVTRAGPQLPKILLSEDVWVGLRISSHPLAQRLLESFGGPITTTSANPSGQPSSGSLAQLKDYFGTRGDLALLSGGDLAPSRGSTVVKLDGSRLELLREGEIPFAEIEKTLEK